MIYPLASVVARRTVLTPPISIAIGPIAFEERPALQTTQTDPRMFWQRGEVGGRKESTGRRPKKQSLSKVSLNEQSKQMTYRLVDSEFATSRVSSGAAALNRALTTRGVDGHAVASAGAWGW